MLEEHLSAEAKLGTTDPDTLPREETKKGEKSLEDGSSTLDNLLNLDDIEGFAGKKLDRIAWFYCYSTGDDPMSKRLKFEVYQSILLRP